MTPESHSPRRRSRTLSLTATIVAVGLLAFGATGAVADLGVRSADRHAGEPGRRVTLTLGCGFCFPPCVGPRGERHPKGFDHGICMLGTDREPPRAFKVFLVPLARALDPAADLPKSPLGLAVPPAAGNDPADGTLPRYILSFTIPDRAPGLYTYLVRCFRCASGGGDPVISDPHSRRWRLRIR